MNQELKICYKFNQQLLRYHSKSFYVSTLLLPLRIRKAVFALYGFCRFADNLVDKQRNRSTDEILDEIKCLENELKIAYRSGESEHPVICAYVHTALEYGIPIDHPQTLFKGIFMDVSQNRYKDFDELVIFCYRVAGVVGLMMTHILGYTDEKAFDYAAKLGIAMQLTNILRDVQEDKNNGRIYIPLNELKQYGLSETDIIEEKMSSSLQELMKFSARRAHQYYEDAIPGIAMLTKDCQFAIHAAGHIYRNILRQIEINDYNPFIGRVYVSQMHKFKLILSNYMKYTLNFRMSST